VDVFFETRHYVDITRVPRYVDENQSIDHMIQTSLQRMATWSCPVLTIWRI